MICSKCGKKCSIVWIDDDLKELCEECYNETR